VLITGVLNTDELSFVSSDTKADESKLLLVFKLLLISIADGSE